MADLGFIHECKLTDLFVAKSADMSFVSTALGINWIGVCGLVIIFILIINPFGVFELVLWAFPLRNLYELSDACHEVTLVYSSLQYILVTYGVCQGANQLCENIYWWISSLKTEWLQLNYSLKPHNILVIRELLNVVNIDLIKHNSSHNSSLNLPQFPLTAVLGLPEGRKT